MRLRVSIVAIVLFCLGPSPAVNADWITLKDGVQIHGTVIRQNKREVYLQLEKGGILTFRMNLVHEVRRSAPEETTTSVRPAPLSPVVRFEGHGSAAAKVEHVFGHATLQLPVGFELTVAHGRYPGYVGELLGLYQNPETEAKVSVTRGPLPFQSTNLEEMRSRLKRHLREESRYHVRVCEPRVLDGYPALYAEFREESNSGVWNHLQAWIPIGRNRIYAVAVSIPERAWVTGSDRYREIVRSFHTRPPSSHP